MNVLPVITRELRAQARQPFTYLLRLYGVAALLVVTFWAAVQMEFTAEGGAKLFLSLHQTLLVAIWILVPLSAADCLSRERREGTLGLLFLTPLSARDIVIAKCAAHAFRAFTLWLASLPVLVLPFLMGGLDWRRVVVSCGLNFTSILLAVGVSVVASALCRQTQRALALAATLGASLILMLGYCLSVAGALAFKWWLLRAGGSFAANSARPDFWWNWAFSEAFSPRSGTLNFLETAFKIEWPSMRMALRGSPSFETASLIAFGTDAVLMVVVALGLVLLAARLLRRRWREAAGSPRVAELERTISRPLLGGGWLRRWLRRRLERNPAGWLDQRTWSGRLVPWLWLAILVSFYCYVFTAGIEKFMYFFDNVQTTLAGLMLLTVAATAAGSFRRERETGVLELLLVTPLSERQIIFGRLGDLWRQFLPSVALLVGIWLFAARAFHGFNAYSMAVNHSWHVLWVLSSFVALPMIGLRNSLVFPGYVSAFVATFLLACVVPLTLVNLPDIWSSTMRLTGLGLGSSASSPEAGRFGLVVGVVVQLLIAITLLISLHRNLVQRRFAQERKPA